MQGNNGEQKSTFQILALDSLGDTQRKTEPGKYMDRESEQTNKIGAQKVVRMHPV